MRLFLILPLFLVLAACATLDENECRAGNWYDIGVSDGAKGRSPDFILQHAKACNEFGIAPKAGPWREGRREGLKFYCTPRNAYDVGTRGAHLAPYCEGVDLATLHAANDRGLRWHRLGQEIASIEREIRQINAELADLSADDPARLSLVAERSILRLDLTRTRAERLRYRF